MGPTSSVTFTKFVATVSAEVSPSRVVAVSVELSPSWAIESSKEWTRTKYLVVGPISSVTTY